MVRDPEFVLAQEGRAWDFLISQSGEWEDRERSWRMFREARERTQHRGLGGLRGRLLGRV
jgi:hypothetical protein